MKRLNKVTLQVIGQSGSETRLKPFYVFFLLGLFLQKVVTVDAGETFSL